jgi:hypothetical protein
MAIKLTDIIRLENCNEYNLHLSCWNGSEHPLDIFLRDENEYKKWQEWKGNQKDGKIIRQKFLRDYILSFVQVYHEGSDIHLFTGIYKIVARLDDKYEVEKINMFQDLVGRLKIKHKRKGQLSSFLFENVVDDMLVHEIMQERLQCRVFKGYGKINLKFTELETIIKKDVKDWRLKLDNLQGVYLLVDDSDNSMYVGSASGEFGIWQRWSDYIYNYTGGNKGLDALHKQVGEDHFKRFFRFLLLEYFTDKTDKNYVIERESFWKDALNTRKFGYNKN